MKKEKNIHHIPQHASSSSASNSSKIRGSKPRQKTRLSLEQRYRRLESEFAALLEEKRGLELQYASELHDLRQPMAIALAATDLALRSDLEEELRQRMLERIRKNMHRAERMIKNWLDVRRIQLGESLPVQAELIDLGGLVRETVEEFSTIVGDRFSLQIRENVQGYWSPELLRRLVENLTSNAVKYGTPGTRVRVVVEKRDGEAVLSIFNQGKTLGAEEQALLFEPYRRATSAVASGKEGWGMGLTISKGIAQSHGGKIHVISREGEGTTFTIELPLDRMKPTGEGENTHACIRSL